MGIRPAVEWKHGNWPTHLPMVCQQQSKRKHYTYHCRFPRQIAFSHSLCRNSTAVVGIVLVLRLLLKQLWQLLGGFCAFFLAPWGISRINLKKYGPWAGRQASSHVFIPLLV